MLPRLAPAAADDSGHALGDRALLSRLTQGAMRKFRFHEAPRELADVQLVAPDGAPVSLGGLRGKITLLAVWASWCPPCKEEIPSLDRVHQRLQGEGLEVVAVQIDKSGTAGAKSSFELWGVRQLVPYADPQGEQVKALGVAGVPTTLLLDRAGREIGRLEGSATWDAPDAILLLRAMLRESTPAR